MDHSRSKLSFIDELNGLRATAIALVILRHWFGLGNDSLNLGDLGVTIFFVLSGFLITRILLLERSYRDTQKKSISSILRSFYLKRVLRIFPIYYLLLLVLFIFNKELLEDSLKWHLSYLSNYYFVIVRHGWQSSLSHLWSLAVEEQFYIIWPLLILFTPSNLLKYLLIIFIIIAPVFRLIYFNPNQLYKYLTPGCFDALALGGMIAYYEKSILQITNKHMKFVNFMIVLSMLFIYLVSQTESAKFKEVFERFSYSIMATFLIVKLLSKSDSLLHKMFRWGPILFIGTISYGLYLYHNLIPFYTIERVPFIFNYVLRVLILLTIASLSYYIIEKPIMRLKKFVK